MSNDQRPFHAGPRAPASYVPISARPRGENPAPPLVPADAQAPVEYAAQLDDSIPRPTPRVAQTGPNGDFVVAEASGDPFFLGFAAGPYYPPAGERVDPQLYAQAAALQADGRPKAETYAFAMFEKRITPARVAELESLGARVLEFHPFYTLKIALPADAIDDVANLASLHWLGLARPWQKVQPQLAASLQSADPNVPIEVWINVFESDLGTDSKPVMGQAGTFVNPDGSIGQTDAQPLNNVWVTHGWMQRNLEDAGVQVLDYNERIHAHRALMLPAAIENLVALDFVQYVEAVPLALAMHDESMDMINADDARQFWTGGTNSRTVAGIVDSGVKNAHVALSHIWGIGWDESGAGNAWADSCNHGSHVCGTILGNDPATPSIKGVSPGLAWGGAGRLFNVRIFNGCSGGVSVSTILGHTSTSYFDGVSTTPKPHVTNNSWGSGATSPAWIGSEGNPRLYDDNAWSGAQLNVFAAGNDGSGAGTVGQEASAKNVLTVGSVLDYNDATEGLPGSIRSTSSRGPTGDGRWKPDVCAPGRWIRSVDATTTTGYMNDSGTSMASPHVTGTVSELIDADASYVYLPERIAAQLMATANTKGDVLLTSPSDSHLNNYGAGRVDGTRMYWSTGGTHTSWAFSLGAGGATTADFTVPAGATRLIAVMHYVEQSSSSGASQALVNNWDFYLDGPPIDPAGNTGDYFVHQSAVGNTEVRILDSGLTAGTWRWKIWPTSTSGTAYFGVTIYVLTSPVPSMSVGVTASDYFVQPNNQVDIYANASSNGGTVSATFLDSTSSGDFLSLSSTTLLDGAVTDLLNNQQSGRDVEVGNMNTYFGRAAHWRTQWSTEGIKNFAVTARADNVPNVADSVNITVDGTAPGLAPNLHSTSHPLNGWSNDTTIDFAWNPATDNLSGVQGYGVSWGNTPGVFVANALDTTTTSYTTFTLSDSASWYFAVKTVDNCDNWTAGTAEVGPYKIDTVAPLGPTGLFSTDHTANVQSCNTTVTMQWTAGSDALSGLAGYVGVWDTSPATDPVGATNIGAGATTFAQNIGSSTSARYFHIRAKDNAGNYGTTRHSGAMFCNATSIASYCTAKTNSLGCVPSIGAVGQPDKSAGTFQVTCTNVLNQKNGLLFWGFGQLAIPFQGGTKCVASPTIRGPSLNSGGSALPANNCTGNYSFTWTTAYMNANGLVPGNTIYAQWWTRDPGSASTTGLSNGIRFTICE